MGAVPPPSVRLAAGPKRASAARLRADSLVVFLRSMALMLESGVHIRTGLELLGRGNADPVMGQVCQRLAAGVDRGLPLSLSMHRESPLFPPFLVRMIQVGEKTGKLSEIFLQLADYEEKSRAFSARVKAALHYPFFVAAAGLTLLLVVPPYLFHSLTPMLRSWNMSLPWFTRLFLFVSDGALKPMVVVPFALGCWLVVWEMRRLLSDRRFAPGLYRRFMGIPALGHFLRLVGTSRFSRAYAVQTMVGIDPVQALVLSAECSTNPLLVLKIRDSVRALREGARLAEALRRAEFFPKGMLLIWEAAEETGDVPEMALRTANMLDEDLEVAAATLSSLMGPVMMGAMGLAAGATIVALLLPLTQMLESVL